MAKKNAFMPHIPKGKNRLELSCIRIENLEEPKIWDIGENLLEESNKKALARVDVKALCFLSINLVLEPDNNPERHVNVIDWPTEKSKQNLIAIELVSKGILHLNPKG